ncbi:MAG TPA: hypothetical protein VG275_06905 [Solirubrobacteraceae bacterium]|jgi:hypothetical protein|nr:hypothetical protein [Solirubrobacteraceae bacterium]
MEASMPPAPAGSFDTAAVHDALTVAEDAYQAVFAGHVPDEVHRFGQFLQTVRMIVDQSADSASKEA